jgi:hypothetical protein
MMNELVALRDILGALPGVKTAKIGVEPNISPDDYPIIRLVPIRILPGKSYAGRTAEIYIHFGTPTTTADGLESVYENLFSIEAGILTELKKFGARYIDTITDEDRLDAYKLMTIRADVTATNVTAFAAKPGSATLHTQGQ